MFEASLVRWAVGKEFAFRLVESLEKDMSAMVLTMHHFNQALFLGSKPAM